MSEEIRIMAEPSKTDPNVCRFTVDRVVQNGGPFLFRTKESGKGSPLIDGLYALSGVSSVIIQNTVLTVTKTADGDWMVLAKQVGGAIRSALLTGKPLLSNEAVKALEPSSTDGALKKRVEEFIAAEINPSVAGHGGVIHVIDVREGTLYIAMGGGCHGCGSADATLKQGVEKMVKEHIPEIKAVLDTTDHAAGLNPYYAGH